MTITPPLYKNACNFLTALAAGAVFALASCSIFEADPQQTTGAITVRLPDQEAISALCAADGVAKNITSDQTTLGQQGQMIQSFKVEARNLAQKKTISQKVAPGATVTIDSLVPGDWDVVIFGYEYSDQHPMFYGNSRGIKVNAGETSQAAVVLNRVEPNTQFSVELEAATSAASLTEDGRANVKKVYVTYEGVELSQKGTAFFTYSDTASQNVMQPFDKNKMLVPVEDFLEPGYSYNAQVYLFGDVLDGYTALWSGNFSGVVQSDGKLVCNLNFLNDYLRIPTGTPVNWQDIKMDQDIPDQLSTQMSLAFEVHTYGAPDGNPKDYSELEIFPAVADACGEVPLIVRYGNLAWTYMFSFMHPVILPTVTVPDQFPLGIWKAFQEVLSPAAPQEWPQCGNDSYYDSYGLLKYYVNGVDKDTWGTIEYASPTGTAQHYYETPVGGSTPTKAQTVNTDIDTCTWTKSITSGSYGYFADGASGSLSGYFTVTGAAWTATPSTIEVEKGGTFTFTLTNAAANAADCQTAAADLNFAVKQGSTAITATPTASGESVVVTATAPSSWAAGSSKSLSVLFGSVGSALGAGSITVNVTDSSGGGTSWSVPARFVAVEGDTIDCGALNITDYDNQTSFVFAAARGTLTVDDLYVCDHEVTREEYAQYMGWCDDEGTFRTTNATDGTANDDKAADNISWLEAIMYCNLRSKAENLDPVYYIVVDGDGKAVATETGTKVYDVEQWIGKFTWKEQSYVQKDGDTGKYYTYNKEWGGGNYPDLYDGDYIKWNHDPSRKGYRLPTEIEWEYCARGGKEGIKETQGVYGGYTTTALSTYAVTQYIVQVRTKTPNHLQLYDMIGNVREWCWDKHSTDAQVVSQGLYGYEGWNYQHVLRGGSSGDYSQNANYLKLWSRAYNCGAYAGAYYGFRVCCNQ